MKIFKIFALAAMMFGMVACDNGEETPEPPFKGNTGYMGTVSVVVDGATVDTPDTAVGIEPRNDGSMLMDIKFGAVKFVPAMPALDITVPNVSYTIEDGVAKLSGSNIIPICMGGEFPMYTVTTLTGTVDPSTIKLDLNFGQYPTKYVGNKLKVE